MKRAISLILALVLVLALTPCALADSPAYGSSVWLQDTNLQNGVVMSDNVFWSDAYGKPRHEYYITYSPGGSVPERPPAVPETPAPEPEPAASEPLDDFDLYVPEWLQRGASIVSYSAASGIQPVVYFGSSVCNLTTTEAAARYYADNGYRVLGAVNGDFFDMSVGYPLGIMVSGGQLLSGSSEYYAAGFRKDGSVVMGAPKLTITAKAENGSSTVIWGLNKPRVDKGGVALITYNYRTDHKTMTTSAGVNVLAHVVSGRMSIGEQMVVQVEQVLEESKSYTLTENQVLLTAAANGYADATGFLRSLMPGQTVTVSVSSPDSRWNDVTEAIGALYLLVEDGVAKTGFEVSAAPRTALGVKENGDLLIYTIDGRQNTVSMGASLGVLAKRMQELGCVTALCLDGGGSTTFVATTPDKYASRTINSPSDKSLRKVTNHLVLIGPGGMTGQPGAVNLSAAAPAVLAGHTVKLTANLADTHYYPMEGGDILYTASGGTVSGNVFTAPETGGLVTVTAYSPNPDVAADHVDIQVLDAPQYVSVQRNGSTVSSLSLQPNETVQLTMAGS
ncbi:MAG: phosphodiester glycosidase family protein, partial [Oscillospiraceae bacterium]|nr:phosphodiester glycosidase family protein [Oscillospiraceae bacterium]